MTSEGLRTKSVEIVTSLLFTAAGAAAVWDSVRLGAGWGVDGPQSGYFPFWIGLILVGVSLGNLAVVARNGVPAEAGLFVTWHQLRLVASVLVPTIIYVAAIPFTGIYLASAMLIAWFMVRLGGFRWRSAVPAGIATALITFVIFEIWFLVALPKGPIETSLGY